MTAGRGSWRVLWMGLLGFVLVLGSACDVPRSAGRFERARFVSLSPAITETLAELGATEALVGVSDFCREPPSVLRLPRTGTVFSPRLEAIAVLQPNLVLTERVAGARFDDLAKLTEVLSLPWLTYDEVLVSTLQLGVRVGREASARELVERYRVAFSPVPPRDAPRVLLAIAHVPGQLSEVYYISRHSIHGRALEAAGARNAVLSEVRGPPRLSLEQVIASDPDVVLVLEPSAQRNAALLDDWRRLSGLRAVREGRLGWVGAPEAEVPGPRIITLIERLRRALADVRKREPAVAGTAKAAP